MAVPADVFGIKDLHVRNKVRAILRGVYPEVPEYVMADAMGERIKAARVELMHVHELQKGKGMGKGKGLHQKAITYPSDAQSLQLMRIRSRM